MDSNTKKILGIADASDDAIAAAEKMLRDESDEFLKVGKRREFGWSQPVNARFAIDHICAAWDTLSLIEKAVAMHYLSNASQWRQKLEAKREDGSRILTPKADEWQ